MQRTGKCKGCYVERIKKVAKRLCKHQELLLNYFSVNERLSNSAVDGFNLNVKLTIRKFFDFRVFKLIEVALYHTLGNFTRASSYPQILLRR